MLKFKSRSWAAIGWKSQSAENKCAAINGYGTNKNDELPEKISIDEEDVDALKPILPSLHVEPIKNKSNTVDGGKRIFHSG